MDTILIATDLSEMRTEVLKTGLDFAKKAKANVDLVTVINKNLDYFAQDTGMAFTDQWLERKYIAESELKKIKEENPELNIQINVWIGDPQSEIIEHAIKNNASMIVIGTHGAGGLFNALLGGTAQYLVKHTPVPVLIVPFNKTRH